MKKTILICLTALVVSSGVGYAQSNADNDAKSQAVFVKIRKIDLIYNLLPVLYTKAQINSLLPAIEACRANARKVMDQEAKDYTSVEPECDKSISDAIDKKILPTRAVRLDLTDLLRAMDGRRMVTALKNIDTVKTVFDKVMTQAQRKAAANTLDPKLFKPDAKPEEMTLDEKLTIYVRQILLDPLSYDLLVQMAKQAN